MHRTPQHTNEQKTIADFLAGKSEHTVALFNHFVQQYQLIGPVTLHPAKTMIGMATPQRRIAYITQLGKNFMQVVFPFQQPYRDNLCFEKIAQVPGQNHQYNHHFRMYAPEDVNEEIQQFMQIAYNLGS
ncbi:hypothetical protein AAE02nite_37270 [Adhaeribacter aerolatus]|uniref:Uncharacterized protein n=1 Tax=Adhaeribacter aerolatus TaxID=670289 RepID=A0A512B275_9BACT|nr:DUF5655 domain-containing protein [Adhaeribacter aerolatus]GEO06063.1 hypothetical protein AAE02nite_37270 [Adhaeribacter aerolatus]